MQLSRVAILILIWIEPDVAFLWLAAALWGFNMGITTTTSRLMLQEIASPEFRDRIMAAYNVSLMSAAPVGSLILGLIIGLAGPLNALIPGMIASVMIFLAGLTRSEIWHYQSPPQE
jgi:MFS-type transporter involved in bile tolerance (Atg22 family)